MHSNCLSLRKLKHRVTLGQLNVFTLNNANKLLESAYHLRLGYIASAVDILAMLLAGHSHPLLGSHLHSLLPSLSKHK